jgi:hypothetical protein
MQVVVVVPLIALALIGGFFLGRRPPALLSEQPLDVRCLVEAVKTELAAAESAQRRENKAALFELKDFEMEVNYVVRNSGGIKAEVVGVGTNLDAGSERVQKLLLRWAAIPNREEQIVPSLSIDPVDVKGKGVTAPADSNSTDIPGCAPFRRNP